MLKILKTIRQWLNTKREDYDPNQIVFRRHARNLFGTVGCEIDRIYHETCAFRANALFFADLDAVQRDLFGTTSMKVTLCDAHVFALCVYDDHFTVTAVVDDISQPVEPVPTDSRSLLRSTASRTLPPR